MVLPVVTIKNVSTVFKRRAYDAEKSANLLCSRNFKTMFVTAFFLVAQHRNHNLLESKLIYDLQKRRLCHIKQFSYEFLEVLKYRNSRFPLNLRSFRMFTERHPKSPLLLCLPTRNVEARSGMHFALTDIAYLTIKYSQGKFIKPSYSL